MSDGHSVGYGRPPQEHRFRKGASGNPLGRPKGSRNLKTELREELNQLVVVREDGADIQISRQRAILRTLTAAASQGDIKSASLILNLCMKLFPPAEDDGDEGLAEADQRVLDDIVEKEISRRKNIAQEEHHEQRDSSRNLSTD